MVLVGKLVNFVRVLIGRWACGFLLSREVLICVLGGECRGVRVVLVRAILLNPNSLAIMRKLSQRRRIWSLLEIHCSILRGVGWVLAFFAAINSAETFVLYIREGVG